MNMRRNIMRHKGGSMKKAVFLFFLVFVAMAFVIVTTAPGDARVTFRGDFVFGPGWWGGPYPYYPYYWEAPYPYSYGRPPVIQQQQPVYQEPAPRTEQQQQDYYWYYCPDPPGYYPYIKQCAKGWLKVVPSAPPDAGK
jgi:hypothetical protein